MKSKIVNKLKNSVRYLGIIIFLIVLYKTDWSSFLEAVSEINLIILFPIILLFIPKNIAIAYRWHLFLKKIGINRSFWANIKVFFSGVLVGTVTPGRFGELYGVVRLKKDGHSGVKAAFSIFFSRFIDISVVLIMSIFAVYLFVKVKGVNPLYVKILLWVGFAIVILFFTGIIYFKDFIAGIAEKIMKKFLKKNIEKDKISLHLENINFSLLTKLVLLTLVFWLIHYFQLYIIARDIGINITFVRIVFVFFLVSMVASIPVTVIGLGTRELAMINFLALFGVAREKSLALSLMTYGIMLLNMTFWTFSWVMEHKHKKPAENL